MLYLIKSICRIKLCCILVLAVTVACVPNCNSLMKPSETCLNFDFMQYCFIFPAHKNFIFFSNGERCRSLFDGHYNLHLVANMEVLFGFWLINYLPRSFNSVAFRLILKCFRNFHTNDIHDLC